MSGVLDRMAKRAMGTLPTVQPLASPHFATPAPVWSENIPEQETNLEIEAPAPRRKSVLSVLRPTETPSPGQNPEALQNDDKAGVLQAHESFPQPERVGTRHARTHSRSIIELKAGNRPSLNHEPAAETERDGEKWVQTKEHTTRAPRIEPEDAESETRAPLPAQLEKQTPAHPAMEIPAREREGHPVTVALGLHRSVARPLSAQPREAATPVEQRTEIQISIGSIELRAPRTETRPQSQPFRPRVTLDEFLRRKPEAGA